MSETPDRWARRDEQSVPLSLQEVEEIDSPWGRPLTCPICGFYYVHFGEPRLEPSDDYGAWNGRGQAVVVPMTCEYGDSWEMVLGFHKGNSYLVTRSHVAGSEESDHHEKPFAVLLRRNGKDEVVECHPHRIEPRMTRSEPRRGFLDRIVGKLLDLAAWWIRRGGWRGRKGAG